MRLIMRQGQRFRSSRHGCGSIDFSGNLWAGERYPSFSTHVSNARLDRSRSPPKSLPCLIEVAGTHARQHNFLVGTH